MKATSVPAMRKWAHRRPSQGCAETSSLTTDDEYFAAWPIWKRHVPGPSPGRSYIRTLRIADSVSPSGNRTVDVKRTIGIAGPTIVVRLPSGSPTATALRKSPGECGDPAHAARASVMAAIEIERAPYGATTLAILRGPCVAPAIEVRAVPCGIRGRNEATPGDGAARLARCCDSINYVDRGNLATAATLIKAELRISPAELGFLLTAFSITYVPMQPVIGWLVERYGASRVLLCGFLVGRSRRSLPGSSPDSRGFSVPAAARRRRIGLVSVNREAIMRERRRGRAGDWRTALRRPASILVRRSAFSSVGC